MPNKKEKEEPQFVVTDRRRFSDDGEVQTPAAPPEPEEAKSAPEPAPVASTPEAPAPPEAATEKQSEEPPPPPLTAEERDAGHRAYKQSTDAMDDQLRKEMGHDAVSSEFKTSFERVLEPFYVTAMMQLGLMGQEGAERRVDIIGARQTIDTLNFLQEKTKNNLTSTERDLFENVLYQLRMQYLEITNALARAVQNPPGGAPHIPKA